MTLQEMVLKMPIAIIGAGPAGLATALSLIKNGYAVANIHLFESRSSAESFKGVEYGLGQTAQTALGMLGLREKVKSMSCPLRIVRYVRQKDGSELKQLEIPPNGACEVSRQSFLQCLLDELQSLGLSVHFNHTVVDVKQSEKGVSLCFTDRKVFECGVLVAADGINSKVRQILAPKAIPKRAQWSSLYAEANIPDSDGELREYSMGSTNTFSIGFPSTIGLFPLPGQRVTIFETHADEMEPSLEKGGLESASPAERKAFALKMASAHGDIYSRAFSYVDWEKDYLWRIRDLDPMETTAFGRIILIGDAGHGVQPCFGMGAGLALMDGALLGHLLGELEEEETEYISNVLQKFSAERAKPTAEAIMANRGASINFRRYSVNDKTTFD